MESLKIRFTVTPHEDGGSRVVIQPAPAEDGILLALAGAATRTDPSVIFERKGGQLEIERSYIDFKVAYHVTKQLMDGSTPIREGMSIEGDVDENCVDVVLDTGMPVATFVEDLQDKTLL